MIKIIDKSKCCGCSACVQRCPKRCITMHDDEEGFLYPRVDNVECIGCGLCEKVCPVINNNKPKKPLEVFAVKNENEDQRLRSSSGGMFILLAEQTIKLGGVVFGAHFNKNWEVEHCFAEKIENIKPLMRSKYVQSRIGYAYKEAEQFLKRGRQVLFVGTSCQIAGLLKFLRKDYDNLLAIDFICHGVPSPGVWRRYLEEIKGNAIELSSVNFRGKQLDGYTWKRYGFVVKGKNGSDVYKSEALKTSYSKAFLQNMILRPSCYVCVAKDGKSTSDFTLGDFWGIQNCHPEFDDDKGIGVLFVHTEKGRKVLATFHSQLSILNSNYNEATTTNPSYCMPVRIPVSRSRFWEAFLKKHYSVGSSLTYANNIPLFIRVLNSLKRIICRK